MTIPYLIVNVGRHLRETTITTVNEGLRAVEAPSRGKPTREAAGRRSKTPIEREKVMNRRATVGVVQIHPAVMTSGVVRVKFVEVHYPSADI